MNGLVLYLCAFLPFCGFHYSWHLYVVSICNFVRRRVAYEESSQRKILKILGKETKTADENNKAAAENGTKQ